MTLMTTTTTKSKIEMSTAAVVEGPRERKLKDVRQLANVVG